MDHTQRPRRRTPRAFTLIELLVVISIISLLVSILLPALSNARQAAMSIRCASQLRQIGIGAMLYINDYDGYFPSRYFHHSTTHASPGIAEYVGAGETGIRDTIFTCPTLQANWTTSHWHRNSTYTSNQLKNHSKEDYGHVVGWHAKLDHVPQLAPTAYIFDGSSIFVAGRSWFYTDNMRDSAAGNLKNPHSGSNNTLFLDGHVATMPFEAFDVTYTRTFWSGI